MRFGGPGIDGVLYKNYSSGRLLEEASLEDKKYIIGDSIKSLPWKLSDETSTLLGHACKKATATTLNGSQVTAWYSTDIPVPIGPDKFSGLPGAILRLDADSSGVIYTATQLLPATNPKELKAPTGGKAIARSDFEKLMDQVMGPADAQGRRVMRRTN
jgi:GLPGLI family protein